MDKFNVGDRVIVKNDEYDFTGTIVQIRADRFISVKVDINCLNKDELVEYKELMERMSAHEPDTIEPIGRKGKYYVPNKKIAPRYNINFGDIINNSNKIIKYVKKGVKSTRLAKKMFPKAIEKDGLLYI